MCVTKPEVTLPFTVGNTIDAFGGGVIGVPGPKIEISCWCEFCVELHLHERAAISPHFARLLRKNFWPPQSVRYVIGSLHADVPSLN